MVKAEDQCSWETGFCGCYGTPLYACVRQSQSVVSDAVIPWPIHSLWNSLCKNTGVGSLSLLQGIFPTQGLNPGLLHCRRILYQLSHKGSPRIPERVAYPFSSGSSWPRNWTGVSCIAGRFFTNWATSEASSFHSNTFFLFCNLQKQYQSQIPQSMF